MNLVRWAEMAEEQLNPLISRKVMNSSNMTLAKLTLREGAHVAKHSHVNEQITMLEQGVLRFVTPDGEYILRAGESMCIPPHLPHSVDALEDSVALDIFAPVREDWLRGDDAYLRK
ncbi:MAG: cupin domain-containing protein [Bryobacteraceae bacterium]